MCSEGYAVGVRSGDPEKEDADAKLGSIAARNEILKFDYKREGSGRISPIIRRFQLDTWGGKKYEIGTS